MESADHWINCCSVSVVPFKCNVSVLLWSMMQHIASVAAVEIRHSDLKKTKQKYFKPESKDGSPFFEHQWPKLVFISSFPKNSLAHLSWFDWAIGLFHKSIFPIVVIIWEQSISAWKCHLFFEVCFLLETVIQADLFHTILYLNHFDPPLSSPLQVKCWSSPLNSLANGLPKHLLEVSGDTQIYRTLKYS